MNWRWVKAFPKYALVFGIIIASSIGFVVWWKIHSFEQAIFGGPPAPPPDITSNLAHVEAKRGRMLLVDNDLYDLDTGAVIFHTWLKGGMPVKIFYEPETKSFLALYERALVRYGPDGNIRAKVAQNSRLALSDDYKWLLYVKDKNLWRADVDLANLKLTNEKKLTAIEQFNDSFFAQNIFFATDKTLVVRNLTTLLRVNLETGDVKPTRPPLGEVGKHKSPDGQCAVGYERGQLIRYDVDEDDIKSVPLGREGIAAFLWLDNDRCAGIAAAGKQVVLYDRKKNTVTAVTALPAPTNRIGEPSPDGRFAFCAGRGSGVLVDFDKKTAIPVTGGEGLFWVSNDTFAYSRELPDTELRGTWLQTVGEGERRVSPEPYLVTKSLMRSEPQMLAVKSAGLVVFVTKHGLSKMKPDGAEMADIAKLVRPPVHIIPIENWTSQR